MKIMLSFLCFSLMFVGCSPTISEKSEIENLMDQWSKLDPSTIGGPSELRNIKEIQEIKIGEIQNSKASNFGCKDCKETEVKLIALMKDGKTENILYQLKYFDGNWAISGLKTEGVDKWETIMPWIDLKVIESRKELNIQSTSAKDNEFENQVKNDLISMLENKVIVKHISLKKIEDNAETGLKHISFDCTLLFTDDLHKENGALAFNKGMTVSEKGNIFSYLKEDDTWKLRKVYFGDNPTYINADEQGILDGGNKESNNEDISNNTLKIENDNREKKWKRFLETFNAAVNNKDKKKIVDLTSNDFFSGGGGETIQEWLDRVVITNNQDFTDFKNTLKGVFTDFKKQDGSIYKATGKYEYGDLFFIYENGKWLFGGVVGD